MTGVTIREELAHTRRKCFALKKEIQLLHAAFDDSELAALRAEAQGYRKALSNIVYRLEEDGEISVKTLRSIVYGALESKNLKPPRRRLIKRYARPETDVA